MALESIVAPEYPIGCPEGELCLPPTNDQCSAAESLGGTIGLAVGSTSYATFDAVAVACNDLEVTDVGIWYSIMGDGNDITIDTCRDATKFDTLLSVYQGDCASGLVCVTANDDSTPFESCSSVTWTSEPGTVYEILVHGYYLDPVGEVALKYLKGSIECDVDTCDSCATTSADTGCDCELCAQAVCIDNPFCCEVGWSGACVNSAVTLCSCEAPPPPANDVCGRALPLSGSDSLIADTYFALPDFDTPLAMVIFRHQVSGTALLEPVVTSPSTLAGRAPTTIRSYTCTAARANCWSASQPTMMTRYAVRMAPVANLVPSPGRLRVASRTLFWSRDGTSPAASLS